MTQTTILAPGVSEAASADITLLQGETATVAIFRGSAGSWDLNFGLFRVIQVSPIVGADIFIGELNRYRQSAQIDGPGVFRVMRGQINSSYGVCKDI